MGNRAVIVTKDTTKANAQNRLGIYLHWCGGEDTVKEFLRMAKEKGIRNPNGDSQYGWARFCQVIGDVFSSEGDDTNTLGVGIVAHLDTRNFDNGVYYIDEDWEIVNHTNGSEFEVDFKGGKQLAQMYDKNATGSFHTALFKAISCADKENLEKLKMVFPEYVYGLEHIEDTEYDD